MYACIRAVLFRQGKSRYLVSESFFLYEFFIVACLCRHADSAPDWLSGIFLRDSSCGAFAGTHEHDGVREKLCKLHVVACASFFLDIYMHFVLFDCVFHIGPWNIDE